MRSFDGGLVGEYVDALRHGYVITRRPSHMRSFDGGLVGEYVAALRHGHVITRRSVNHANRSFRVSSVDMLVEWRATE